MWRATWKGLIGHKLRVALTAVAITLGVGLVAGSYVFTDTLTRVFDDLFADAFAGIDVQIRGTLENDLGFAFPERMDQSLVDEVAAVPGVADAVGTVGGILQLVDSTGETVGGQGPPTIGGSWADVATPFRIKEDGRPPSAPGEVVIDAGTATRSGIDVGDDVTVIALGGPQTFTVVGLVSFAGSDSFGGATFLGFDFATAQDLFQADEKVDAISVVGESGVTPEELIDRITQILPDRAEAVSGETAAEDQLATFKQALSFLNTFLLVFGMVALFVGAFIIQNTFQIIVAQRTRELALLRALGASRRQVTGMVLAEAGLIGLVASALGVALGMGLALFMTWGFQTFGGDLPSGTLALRTRTVIIAVATGLVVTLISAYLPARRAGAIPPVAAMRTAAVPTTRRSLRSRLVTGSGVTAVGLILLVMGLSGRTFAGLAPIAIVGGGAGVLFVGISIMTPVITRPVGRVLGSPLPALAGTAGHLARENAVRSPRRTSATASALMIGVALIGLVLIMAASIRATTDALLEERFRSDLIVQAGGFGGVGLSPEVANRIEALPQVALVTRIRQGPVRLGDEVTFVSAADLATLEQALSYDVAAGSLPAVGPGEVAISTEVAAKQGWALGDTVDITFSRTGTVPLTVAAVFERSGPGAGILLDLTTWEDNFIERFDSTLFVVLVDPSDPSGREAIEAVAEQFPGSAVLDQTEFREEAASQLDGFVLLIFALLGLALVIAFFGIANTLLLSVVERTREIGLLRAVGATRRQIRRMVTWESVIIAVFGALTGIALGVFFGWAVIQALSDDTEIVLAIPAGRLLIAVVAAGVAGVIAAIYPARRASRLNVLEAIAYE